MNNTTSIKKLVFGGQALGISKEKTVFLWNALPQETVEFKITKSKKDYTEGIATKIFVPSPSRIEPEEDHYLSCSPWQILSWEAENYWKKEIAKEILKIDDVDITVPKEHYGYRNKMEFSFFADKKDTTHLALFERGQYARFVKIDGCKLAKPCVNNTAKEIVSWLNEEKVPIQILKNLMVRCNEKDGTLAALFIREPFAFERYPEITDKLMGFHVFLSGFKSAAPRIDGDLFHSGNDFLDINIGNKTLKFGLLSFFQVNPPVFESALSDISNFIDADSEVVDYYCGIGAISIPLSDKIKSAVLVDISEESITFANENILANNLSCCNAISAPAEKAFEHINSNSVVIFDPPRAGLHKNTINKITKDKPVRIIYLSCNLSTQARDIGLLKEYYKIRFQRIYNFFPRTPHIEGLCVLDRKN